MRVLSELEEKYPDIKYDRSDLVYSMDQFYRKSGVQFVIILDEWVDTFESFHISQA